MYTYKATVLQLIYQVINNYMELVQLQGEKVKLYL